MAELYPVDEKGLVIPIHELELPESRIPTELLDEGEPYVNNHHMYYEARVYGKEILWQTFRQLEGHIEPLPIDTHRILHQRFKGVKVPPLPVIIEMVEEAYETGGRIMSGNSSKNPKPISEERIKKVRRNYNELRRYGS